MYRKYDLETKWKENKCILYIVIATVFFWGFLAHGYRFFQSDFTHDSLNEFSSAYGNDDWKIQLGRFVVPLYKEAFRTDLTLPWLIGILSLIWIGLSVFLIVKMFRVQSKGTIFLVAGIFTANITVAATAASFLHDLDCDMFALFCSVAAVYLWRQHGLGSLLGIVSIAISLGIYQSYLSVTIVLVMLICILDLLEERDWKLVLRDGIKAVVMILVGGVLYYVIMRIVLSVTGITLSSGGYNSLDKALELSVHNIGYLTAGAYRNSIFWLFNAFSTYPRMLIKLATGCLILIAAALIFLGFLRKEIGLPGKILCIGFIVLLPVGMNITYILTTGMVHELMVFGVWCAFLLILIPLDRLTIVAKENKCAAIVRGACFLLVFVLLYGNVQTANALYLKKDMEQEGFLSLMNRVLYRMEEVPEYESGSTPVVFAGETNLLNDVILGFEDYVSINGMERSAVAGLQEDFRVRTYFQYVLNNPANIADAAIWRTMQEDPRVLAMPGYPREGCIQMVDGILVVKLGEK